MTVLSLDRSCKKGQRCKMNFSMPHNMNRGSCWRRRSSRYPTLRALYFFLEDKNQKILPQLHIYTATPLFIAKSCQGMDGFTSDKKKKNTYRFFVVYSISLLYFQEYFVEKCSGTHSAKSRQLILQLCHICRLSHRHPSGTRLFPLAFVFLAGTCSMQGIILPRFFSRFFSN